jgi:hypothetical protein
MTNTASEQAAEDMIVETPDGEYEVWEADGDRYSISHSYTAALADARYLLSVGRWVDCSR